MKLLAISDIHGSEKMIHQILGTRQNYDYIIIAGDFSKNGDSESALRILDLLKPVHHKLITVHGNWDTEEVQNYLKQNTMYLHDNGIVLDDFGFFGAGGSNITPMKTPVEYTDSEFLNILNNGHAMIAGSSKKILVSHAPPKGYKDRTFFGLRAGSAVITDFMNNNAITLCICGHIHEASGKVQTENSIVINAASVRKKHFYFVDLNDEITVKKIRIP